MCGSNCNRIRFWTCYQLTACYSSCQKSKIIQVWCSHCFSEETFDFWLYKVNAFFREKNYIYITYIYIYTYINFYVMLYNIYNTYIYVLYILYIYYIYVIYTCIYIHSCISLYTLIKNRNCFMTHSVLNKHKASSVKHTYWSHESNLVCPSSSSLHV